MNTHKSGFLLGTAALMLPAEDLHALEASVCEAVLEHEHEVEWLRVAEDG